MDVIWIDDRYLAALRTDPSPDKLEVYRFDPAGPSLTEVEAEDIGTLCTYLAIHPTREYLYVNDSGSGRVIRAFAIAADGTLTLIDSEPTGNYYGLELALTHDGTKLYAAGGITSVVLGFVVGPDGGLAPMVGSPFPESGDSPSNVFASSDDAYLLVGHGTDATLRSAAIDPVTGNLAYTGAVFDVGLQGTLGDVASLDDIVFVTDNSSAIDGLTGIYSFHLGPDGSFAPNGSIQATGGVAPRSVAVWKPSIIGIDEESGTSRMVLGAFPNPARDQLRIVYRIARPGLVTVDLLDVSGRKVRRLVAEPLGAGDHTVTWDGLNDRGHAAPAGVYFARIRSEGGEATQRVILLR